MDKFDMKNLISRGSPFSVPSSKFDKFDLKELIVCSIENNNCMTILDEGNFDKFDLKELFSHGAKIQMNPKWDAFDMQEFIDSAKEAGGTVIV